MIDLTNPSLLIMTEFELIAAVAAFAAIGLMAVRDCLARVRSRRHRAAEGGDA
jgi:hypothetical protein